MPERFLGIRVDCAPPAGPAICMRLEHVLNNLGCHIVRGTYGHEVSVKSKKQHFHWHIQVNKDGQAFSKHLSKQIKSHYDRSVDQELENDPTSTASPLSKFSIKVLEQPEDANRFFRYPFKDIEEYDLSLQRGFTDQELHDMMTQARTEREIALKTFEKHENKLNNDKQNRALLWEYLDQMFPDIELRMSKINPDRSNDPCRLVGSAIVKYNIEYNDHKIPMDIKRRTICYLAYRGLESSIICDILWK